MSNNKILKFILKEIRPKLLTLYEKKILKLKFGLRSKSLKKYDPVTRLDLIIEEELNKLIHKYYPDHDIEGEEIRKTLRKNSKYRWTIDPIDGTKAFVLGLPTWSNLIGVDCNEKPIFGFANFPEMNKYYFNDESNSYLVNKKKKIKISSSKTKNLKKSKLVINSLHTIKNSKFLNFFKKYKYFLKISGADAYNYCKLAEGKIDIIIEAGLKKYDIKPLIPIIKKSGAIISNWNGDSKNIGPDVIVAANKNLHEQILKEIKKIK